MQKEDVIGKIGAKNWKEFERFMIGQTVGTYPDGTADYYECDVENFLHKKVTGRRLFFDWNTRQEHIFIRFHVGNNIVT